MENSVLDIQTISKTYAGHQALSAVSFKLYRGEIFGLLGPNGAGKTSLIRIINQITYPDQGIVLFEGEPLRRTHISHIGYLPEERGLYKNMKVGEQLLYLAQLKGLSKAEAKECIKFWLDRLEINTWYNKKLSMLSKGMAQKVQFVVTVLHSPKLLIFDEPFSGFDPVNAELIKNEMLYLKAQGTSIIFSTHRMESVEQLCDRIALIHKSEKILEGSINDIKQRYKDGTYRVLLEPFDKNSIMDKLSSLGELLSQADEQGLYTCVIRPYDADNLLSELIHLGRVQHYTEVLPSMNEVFIKVTTHE